MNSSVGNGDPAKERYLVDCSEGPDDDTGPMACDWWQPPAKPGSAAAALQLNRQAEAAAQWEKSPEADALRERLAELGYAQ